MNLIPVREFANRKQISTRRVVTLIHQCEIWPEFVSNEPRIDWDTYQHWKPKRWAREYDFCRLCESDQRKHHKCGMCRKCYDESRMEGRWHRRYEACRSCGLTDSAHQARGLCKRCYMREYELATGTRGAAKYRPEPASLRKVVVDLGPAGKVEGRSDMVTQRFDDELGVNVILEKSKKPVWMPIGYVRAA